MRPNDITDLAVLPLYSQYLIKTLEPIVRQVKAIDPDIHVLLDFCRNESYTDLLAQSIREI